MGHDITLLGRVRDRMERFYEHHPGGVVAIWGATATGKTSLSVAMAEHWDVSVVSSDSRQVYRRMDIGTDKVSAPIRQAIPHYQIDIIDPDESYTVGAWQASSNVLIDDIIATGRKPLVVGGTGLYIDSVYKNFVMPGVGPDEAFRAAWYARELADPGCAHRALAVVDPVSADRLDPTSMRYVIRALEIYEQTGKPKSFFLQRRRPRWPLLMLGLWRDTDDSKQLIAQRVDEMLAAGLIDETAGLLEQGYGADLQSMQGIGYKQTVAYLGGVYDKQGLADAIKQVTYHLAKKQRTWFRRYIADAQVGYEGVEYEVYTLSA